MLVEVGQQILDNAIGTRIAGIGFRNRSRSSKLRGTIGIEICVVAYYRIGLKVFPRSKIGSIFYYFLKFRHKVHKPKHMLPVNPIDLLDIIRLRIDDRFDGIFRIETEQTSS